MRTFVSPRLEDIRDPRHLQGRQMPFCFSVPRRYDYSLWGFVVQVALVTTGSHPDGDPPRGRGQARILAATPGNPPTICTGSAPNSTLCQRPSGASSRVSPTATPAPLPGGHGPCTELRL